MDIGSQANRLCSGFTCDAHTSIFQNQQIRLDKGNVELHDFAGERQ